VVDLGGCGVRFALVGGLAVSARCEPRFTRDIDLAVAVASDAEAEAVVRRLMQCGYRVLAQVEHESAGQLATVRLAPPGDLAATGVVVDLLFASSGLESELVESSEPLEIFDGVTLPVVRVPGLIATKVLASEARRPQDLVDARSLLDVASTAEIDETLRLLRLVEQRGFHRGKDLVAALQALRGH
jgi:predicted nucleotidyltransferase